MNVINLYPFKIVITGDEAYLLPNNGNRHQSLLILRNELMSVRYAGRLSEGADPYVSGGEGATCYEVINLLSDRGVTTLHAHWLGVEVSAFQDVCFHRNITMRSEDGLDDRLTREQCFWRDNWLSMQEIVWEREMPSFHCRRSILRWLLQQPEILFNISLTWGCFAIDNPALERIIGLSKWLVPNWQPSMEFALGLQSMSCGDQMGDNRFVREARLHQAGEVVKKGLEKPSFLDQTIKECTYTLPICITQTLTDNLP